MRIREIAKFGQLPFIISDESVEHSMNIIRILIGGYYDFIIETHWHLHSSIKGQLYKFPVSLLSHACTLGLAKCALVRIIIMI